MQKRMIYLLIAFAVSAALALAPASAQAAAGGNGGGGAGGGGGLSLLAPGIKLPINPLNPGLVFCILFTAALVNCCIISGFCRIISSIPGIDDLNIVFVI